jgi:hypothetical protein
VHPRNGAPPGADAPRAPTLDPGRPDVDAVRLSVGPLLAAAEQAVARGADILAPPEASLARGAPGAEGTNDRSGSAVEGPAVSEAAPGVDAPAAAMVGALSAEAQTTSAGGTEALAPAVGVSTSDATEAVATLVERVDAAAVLPASVDVAVSDPLGEWSMSVRHGTDGIDVALSGDRAFAAAVAGVEEDLRRALGTVGQELRSVSVREDRAAVAPTASTSASSMSTAGGGAAPHGREPAPARVAERPVPGARNKGSTAGPSATGSASPVLPRRGVLLDRTA